MKTATIEPIRATNDQELGELVQHMTEISAKRVDRVVSSKDIKAVVIDDMVKFAINQDSSLPPVVYEPTYRGHETMWNRLDIPKQYYLRMGEQDPDLLTVNVNTWLDKFENKNFLARTIDGMLRAFMSDRFRILDSTELFFTTFDRAKHLGAKIVQADLTENNFYMKVLRPDYAQKVENFRTDVWARKTNRPGGSLYHVLDHLEEDGGQWLVPGVSISNSDVGSGSLSIDLFIFDTICWNGLVHNRAIHQVHLGKQLDVGVISMETRQLEDQVVFSKINDHLTAALGDEAGFLALVKKLQGAAETPLEEPTAAVDLVVKNFGFSDDDKTSILNELMAAGSPTVYGLITAVTAAGRDKTNYDIGRKFEEAGGDILENPREFVKVRRDTVANRR